MSQITAVPKGRTVEIYEGFSRRNTISCNAEVISCQPPDHQDNVLVTLRESNGIKVRKYSSRGVFLGTIQ